MEAIYALPTEILFVVFFFPQKILDEIDIYNISVKLRYPRFY